MLDGFDQAAGFDHVNAAPKIEYGERFDRNEDRHARAADCGRILAAGNGPDAGAERGQEHQATTARARPRWITVWLSGMRTAKSEPVPDRCVSFPACPPIWLLNTANYEFGLRFHPSGLYCTWDDYSTGQARLASRPNTSSPFQLVGTIPFPGQSYYDPVLVNYHGQIVVVHVLGNDIAIG